MAKRGESSARFGKAAGEKAHGESLGLPPGYSIVNGEEKLLIKSARGDSHDVTSLKATGPLAEQLAIATARMVARMKNSSGERTKLSTFKFGYLKFCEETRSFPSTIEEFTWEHSQSFIQWLSHKKSLKRPDGLKKENKIKKLGAYREVLHCLSECHPELDVNKNVPTNAWGHEASTNREPLTVPLEGEDLFKLVSYIEQVIEPLLDKVDKFFPPSEFSLTHNASVGTCSEGRIEYRICKILCKISEYVPDRDEIWSVLIDIQRGAKAKDRLSAADIDFCTGPTTAQLYIFFLYLLIYTGFNQQPMRDLRLSDIKSTYFMDQWETIIRSEKHRSNSAVRRVTRDSPLAKVSTTRVIDCLRRWTSLSRKFAPAATRDHLFLYIPEERKPTDTIRSYASEEHDSMATPAIRNQAMRLGKELGMGQISTRVIRATVAQLLYSSTEGDELLVAAAMHHKNPSTTHQSYRPISQREVDESRLAGVMGMRVRHLESKGKYDPRSSFSPSEVTGVTPGWGCMDNLDSPQEGQIEGRPCTAYPFCPACPLRVPVSNGAYVLARTIQLFGKLDDLSSQVGPAQVKARFGDLMIALEDHRRFYSKNVDVVAEAAKMKLGPLPDLE